MSRRMAIKKRCLNCSAGNRTEVEGCRHLDCPLYPFRTGHGKQDPKTRDKVIKAHCAWCSNSRTEVLHCPVIPCPLFPFRKSTVDHSTGPHTISRKPSQIGNIQTSGTPDNIIPYPEEAICHD